MPRSLKKDFQFFAIPQLTILPQLRNLHHHRVQNDILRSIDDGGRVMLPERERRECVTASDLDRLRIRLRSDRLEFWLNGLRPASPWEKPKWHYMIGQFANRRATKMLSRDQNF